MANTTVIQIPGGDVWTLISSVSGRLNVSDPCFYCKSSVLPNKSLQGHRLDDSDTLDFVLLSTEQLYVKSKEPFRAVLSDGGFGFDEWFRLMTKGQKAVIIQNYIEANVKNGLQFYLRALYESVAVGSTVYLKFQTGAKKVVIKSREVTFTGSSKLDYVAMEDGTYTGGTPLIPGNENRISPAATTVTLSVGGTGSGGSEFRRKRIFGSGQETGNSSRLGTDTLGIETLLKPNTLYYVSMTNVAGVTGEFQLELSWYEGDTDLP